VGVRNIASDRKFRIDTRFSGTAINPAGRTIPEVEESYINEHWLGQFSKGTAFLLKKGQSKVILLQIKADVNTAPGTTTQKGDYIFDVCVFDMTDGASQCVVENRNKFYTDRMYQVTVRVI
jgi:hypothetical protein